METVKIKKTLCVVPGIGLPTSVYYFVTSKDLRKAAIKGLLLIPASAFVLAMSVVMPIPGAVLLLAGAYLYWGTISLLVGAGFLTLLFAKFFTARVPEVEIKKEKIPLGAFLKPEEVPVSAVSPSYE